jgi:peptide/nickel transport system permease protein
MKPFNLDELRRLLTFVVQRLFQAIFVLLGLSILIFIIARVLPGDPARTALGARAPQEVVDRLRDEMHLNEPLTVQYYYWLTNALRGDLGNSLVTRRSVTTDIAEFLPASLELVIFAGIITGVGGILLGTLSARHKDTWIDNVIRLISYIGVVTPAFIFAIVFLLVFGLALDWLPSIGRLTEGVPKPPLVTGFLTVDALLAGQFSTFGDAFTHLIMPGVALALGSMAQEARITRSSMADNLTKDYIAAERALGIPDRLVMGRFLLKPSLIPTVSIFALDFAANLANAFLVELIFNWPGLSRYGVNAMLRKDLNAIIAVILILGVIFVVMNIFVDLIVGGLDPRIRLRAARSD